MYYNNFSKSFFILLKYYFLFYFLYFLSLSLISSPSFSFPLQPKLSPFLYLTLLISLSVSLLSRYAEWQRFRGTSNNLVSGFLSFNQFMRFLGFFTQLDKLLSLSLFNYSLILSSWLWFLIWALLGFFFIAIEDKEGSGSIFVTLFVHCLEDQCGFHGSWWAGVVGAWVSDCLWQLMNACAFLCGGGDNLLWVLFKVLIYVLNNMGLLLICYVFGCGVDGVVYVLMRCEKERQER